MKFNLPGAGPSSPQKNTSPANSASSGEIKPANSGEASPSGKTPDAAKEAKPEGKQAMDPQTRLQTLAWLKASSNWDAGLAVPVSPARPGERPTQRNKDGSPELRPRFPAPYRALRLGVEPALPKVSGKGKEADAEAGIPVNRPAPDPGNTDPGRGEITGAREPESPVQGGPSRESWERRIQEEHPGLPTVSDYDTDEPLTPLSKDLLEGYFRDRVAWESNPAYIHERNKNPIAQWEQRPADRLLDGTGEIGPASLGEGSNFKLFRQGEMLLEDLGNQSPAREIPPPPAYPDRLTARIRISVEAHRRENPPQPHVDMSHVLPGPGRRAKAGAVASTKADRASDPVLPREADPIAFRARKAGALSILRACAETFRKAFTRDPQREQEAKAAEDAHRTDSRSKKAFRKVRAVITQGRQPAAPDSGPKGRKTEVLSIRTSEVSGAGGSRMTDTALATSTRTSEASPSGPSSPRGWPFGLAPFASRPAGDHAEGQGARAPNARMHSPDPAT